MDAKKIINMMHLERGAKICTVAIHEGRGSWTSPMWSYLYFGDLAVDDFVVVDTKYGPALAKVAENDVDYTTIGCRLEDLRYVIDEVNREPWEMRVAEDQNAEKAMARAQLKTELDKYRESLGAGVTNSMAKALGYTDEATALDPLVAHEFPTADDKKTDERQ